MNSYKVGSVFLTLIGLVYIGISIYLFTFFSKKNESSTYPILKYIKTSKQLEATAIILIILGVLFCGAAGLLYNMKSSMNTNTPSSSSSSSTPSTPTDMNKTMNTNPATSPAKFGFRFY